MTNGFVVNPSPQYFNLSRNESLRTIRVTAWSIDMTCWTYRAPEFLQHALSTITSPSFFQVVVVYRWQDFHGMEVLSHPGSNFLRRFDVFHEVREVRDLQLVLSVEDWGPLVEASVRMLRKAVAEEGVKHTFSGFLPEALVTYRPCRRRTINHIGEVVRAE